MEPARIFVCDDDTSSRELLARILTAEGHRVTALADGREALDRLGAPDGPPDLVVSDIRMGDVDGLALTDALRQRVPDTPVILVTAFGNIDGAVDAIRRGAFDYISKPYDVDAIKVVVARALEQRRLALENRALRRDLRDKYHLENVVGRSEAMLQVYKTAARVALTGAQAMRRGLFEEANQGTLFLDEIGDVGPNLQARLLRALQEGTIRRVGTNEPIAVDVRVVAATNKDLAQAVKDARFREDLFYRLNVVTIRIPPLRERREDIPLLAEHFAAKHGRAEGAAISPAARDLLVAYHWPGNVRELENVVARGLALNPSGVILPADLPEQVRGSSTVRSAHGAPAL